MSAAEPQAQGTGSYELFIGALSCLSVFNLLLLVLPLNGQEQQLILIVDGMLTLIFLTDFALRFTRADSKRDYFLHGGGWLDLVGSLPLLRIFRLFRVWRVAKLIRQYGLRKVLSDLLHSPAQGSLLLAILLAIVTLEFGGAAVLAFERQSSHANILTGGQAIWWGVVTVTTVGYGDYTPVTAGGRFIAVVMMIIGIGLFGTFTSYLATKFLAPRPAPATTADATPPGPRARLEEIQRQLEEHEKASEKLRADLAEVAASL